MPKFPPKQPFDVCTNCNGKGVVERHHYEKGKKVVNKVKCNQCGGTGRKRT